MAFGSLNFLLQLAKNKSAEIQCDKIREQALKHLSERLAVMIIFNIHHILFVFVYNLAFCTISIIEDASPFLGFMFNSLKSKN